MGSLRSLILVLSQGKVALTVLFGVYLETIVEKIQHMPLKPIDFQSCVRLYYLCKGMVFQTLVIPDL